MSIEKNKEIACGITEAHNEHNIDKARELLTDNFVSHFAGLPMSLNKEAYLAQMETSTKAFSNFHFTIEDIVAEGDKVVVRLTAEGTHIGEFMGIPATNKHVTFTGIAIRRIQDGQVAEEWHNNDMFGFMQQLGVIPTRQ